MKRLSQIKEIPELVNTQIDKYTRDSLNARRVAVFDKLSVSGKLRSLEGRHIIAVDLGGHKAQAGFFEVETDDLIPIKGGHQTELPGILENRDGVGYLEFLRKIAIVSKVTGHEVGVSVAGPGLERTVLKESPNLKTFVEDLGREYAGDFRNLFGSNVSVVNDAVAGLMASSIESYKLFDNVENVLFFINGGGIGGAVLKSNEVWATEPGHVEVIDELNKINKSEVCGVRGQQFVCVENVAASGAGIEDLWQKIKGEKLGGFDIKKRYEGGDDTAFELYRGSAELSAHVIAGMGKAFGLFNKQGDTVAVCHGGIFKVDGFGEYLRRILEKHFGYSLPLMFTKNYPVNMSLIGAGVALFTENKLD